MDSNIALILTQDGLTNGAVYGLLAISLVLVFATTRIIFIPQGELVAYGALTIAAMQAGSPPLVAWLLLALGISVFFMDVRSSVLGGLASESLLFSAIWNLAVPTTALSLAMFVSFKEVSLAIQVVFTAFLVTSVSRLIYRLVYEPVARESVLLLLIISVAMHFVLVGLGLVMFGPDGVRSTPFFSNQILAGPLTLTGQSLAVYVLSITAVVALWVFFSCTLLGKALRATAVNLLGARLMGIDVHRSGRLAFTLTGFIAALSGVLIGPITTLYYDSGLLIGLKGFVAAILGGLASYPLAAAGALLVGLIEAFASYFSSSFKEIAVFTLIIPVLLWRSIQSGSHGEEEDS